MVGVQEWLYPGNKEMTNPVSSALQCRLSLLSLVPHLQDLHVRGAGVVVEPRDVPCEPTGIADTSCQPEGEERREAQTGGRGGEEGRRREELSTSGLSIGIVAVGPTHRGGRCRSRSCRRPRASTASPAGRPPPCRHRRDGHTLSDLLTDGFWKGAAPKRRSTPCLESTRHASSVPLQCRPGTHRRVMSSPM